MHYLMILISLFTLTANALEIDEKLTLRVVKVSDTRKTILINRGQEDGIVKGDHAKFYLSIGVVARGVAIKISPTRSVWSLYRLVNADYVRNDEVMKLKITAPVKITNDESRALVGDDSPSTTTKDPRDLGIPLAAGAEDLNAMEATPGQTNVAAADMGILNANLLKKNREIFGAFTYESRSSKTTSENSNLDYSGSDTYLLMDAGFEYYTRDENKWYSRLSVVGAFRSTQTRVMAYEGTEVNETASFFGGGLNWYPFNRPSTAYKIIPFGQFMYYMGSVDSEVSVKSGTAFSGNLSGAVTMFSAGGGVKYYLHSGWGASAKLEFQSRADSYSEDVDGLAWQKVSSGPRIIGSLRYRF